MARYLVTAKCQDLAERGYILRYEGEIVELPDDAPVPKWFKRIDGPAAEVAPTAEISTPAPKTPVDVVADVLLGTTIPGMPEPVVNAKNPLAVTAKRPGRPPGSGVRKSGETG